LYAAWRHPENGLTFSLWLNHNPKDVTATEEIFVKYQIHRLAKE
jgi:hypothetical protein